MSDYRFTYHPTTGVPLRDGGMGVADREPENIDVQYRLLMANIERLKAEPGQPRERYKRSAEGHVLVR